MFVLLFIIDGVFLYIGKYFNRSCRILSAVNAFELKTIFYEEINFIFQKEILVISRLKWNIQYFSIKYNTIISVARSQF